MKLENLLSLTLPNPDPSGDPLVVKGPPGVDTTSGIILNLPTFLLTSIVVIGIIAAIVFILISGIQWILSGGDEKQVEGARKRLTYSIIGLAVIILSFAVISFVFGLIGIDPRPFSLDFFKPNVGISQDCIDQFGYEACVSR